MNRDGSEKQVRPKADRTANLIPFNQRTPEEHKALSRKGGLASGKARRKKRAEIEKIKLTDKAIKEQKRENLMTIRDSAKILLEAKRTFDKVNKEIGRGKYGW